MNIEELKEYVNEYYKETDKLLEPDIFRTIIGDFVEFTKNRVEESEKPKYIVAWETDYESGFTGFQEYFDALSHYEELKKEFWILRVSISKVLEVINL